MTTKPTSAALDLDYPIEHEGQTISRLVFRRMRAGDTLVAEGEDNPAMAGYRIFAALAEVDLAVILKVDIDDLERMSGVVEPLMGKSGSAAAAKARETATAAAP